MSAIREFSSVSIASGSRVVQINTTQSNFSIQQGSVLAIAGDRPRLVASGDTTNRTITLQADFDGEDVNEVSAALIPMAGTASLLSALTSMTDAQTALTEAYDTQELPEDLEQTLDFVESQAAKGPTFSREQNLSYRLADYPTFNPTIEAPTGSPNNVREIRFDEVRKELYFSLSEEWLKVPTVVSSRKFAVFYRGLVLRFNNNNAYTGNVKMRVYPMGKGGEGLPGNPSFIQDHKWQTYETTVTELYKIGEFDRKYFEGIIDYIELDDAWVTLDVDQSDVASLNAKFDVAFGTLRSPFETFYQRADGFWYSEDVTPDTPYSMGSSWLQSISNPRRFVFRYASDGDDALRFFSHTRDDYTFEVIVVVDSLDNHMSVTITNQPPNVVYEEGTFRFIVDRERLYFKRNNASITGSMTVESIRIRIPSYE